MAKPLIHPNWDKTPAGITDGFSLEMTAKDIARISTKKPSWWNDTDESVKGVLQ